MTTIRDSTDIQCPRSESARAHTPAALNGPFTPDGDICLVELTIKLTQLRLRP